MANLGLLVLCLCLCACTCAHEDVLKGDESWYRSRATGRVHWTGPPPGPPPSFPTGISFAGTVTDNAVLQKGVDTSAAIYGIVTGSVSSATTITLQVIDNGNVSDGGMTIPAKIMTRAPDNSNVTWKALLPPHPDQGGNISITASCTGCHNQTAASISGLTYGDVWICSGQSNMELPMQHALTQNRTYDLVDNMHMYSNIRTFKHGDHVASFDGDEVYILGPPPPPAIPDNDGVPSTYYGWQLPNSSKVMEFSAACWFFAQEISDIYTTENKTAPIIGMIQSAWGGTEIDDWINNRSIPLCKNASGGPEPNRQDKGGAVYPDNGALNNGMIAPFLNYTIFGALWYQGENNVHECIKAGNGRVGDGGPNACGNSLNATGYACSMKNLVNSWRDQWSVTPQTTSKTFAFGIVSLAAGTSEGNDQNMPNFRLAQTASYGFLPGPQGSGMENTFIAQAYDAGDPGVRTGAMPKSETDSPFQKAYDAPFPGRVGYSAAGYQSFTPQYMGGLHPRAKQTVGRRLALAALAVAYGQDVPFTGPVLSGCSIFPEGALCMPGRNCSNEGSSYGRFRQISINFDEKLLGDDAVKVWSTTPDTEGLTSTAMWRCLNGTCLASCGDNVTCAQNCAILKAPHCQGWLSRPVGPSSNGLNPSQYDANHFHFATSKAVSPLEVQLNNTIWMPISISFNALNTQSMPINTKCRPGECVNFTKVDGWSSVFATVPVALPLGCQQKCKPKEELGGAWCENCTHDLIVTGLRYAWSDTPCCGGDADTSIVPCPVNSCPISTWNSTLPAVPFTAMIKWNNATSSGIGKCECHAPQQCS